MKSTTGPTITPRAPCSVLELARHFGHPAKKLPRKLVFMTFTGEEEGLIGSAYYVKNPVFPLDKTIAMINLDMVGRSRRTSSPSTAWHRARTGRSC